MLEGFLVCGQWICAFCGLSIAIAIYACICLSMYPNHSTTSSVFFCNMQMASSHTLRTPVNVAHCHSCPLAPHLPASLRPLSRLTGQRHPAQALRPLCAFSTEGTDSIPSSSGSSISPASNPRAAGRSTYKPSSFQELVEHATEAVLAGIADGHYRLEVEFPALPGSVDSELLLPICLDSGHHQRAIAVGRPAEVVVSLALSPF
jgi:hypothetical protein